jgi:excisionase family DNA binding protein
MDQIGTEADERLMAPAEVADYLSVPLQTVYLWNSQGTGPRSHRVGRHTRYRRADVEAWLEARADAPKRRHGDAERGR